MSEFTQPTPPLISPPPVPTAPSGPNPPAANPGHGGKGPNIILTAIITAILTALVTSIGWVAVGMVIYKAATTDPPPFDVLVEAPEIMEVGNVAVMKVIIGNQSDKPITLGSIDIMDTLFDGFEVISVDPKPSSQDSLFGIYSYYSRHKLDADDTVTFKFTIKATEVGEWYSSVDACTPFENYVSEWVEIDVVEKGGIE